MHFQLLRIYLLTLLKNLFSTPELWLGMLGGYCFDALSFLTQKKLTISSVRVKKFCATTQFDATKITSTDFKAPYTLAEGLAHTLEFEFIRDASEGITFSSE
ncbi:N-acetyl-alpha-D-glucosaminyl-diphospho-ditrans octacis-undecaprenol 4-epimerase [termite gut metagenome]|uniref:N-acetyl-alpha-D-glucosaminyl-diphospho-ditrans octacis-undecaprenol 4-epimerase n=1 Tax=termite gut metagenome TaxID=433724 RepID=A0A5J4RYW7_9ZZZZ